jgi:hypothetical protein
MSVPIGALFGIRGVSERVGRIICAVQSPFNALGRRNKVTQPKKEAPNQTGLIVRLAVTHATLRVKDRCSHEPGTSRNVFYTKVKVYQYD